MGMLDGRAEHKGRVAVGREVDRFARLLKHREFACGDGAAGFVARIHKGLTGGPARVDELFLKTLSRLPSPAEQEACVGYIQKAPTLAEGLRGLLWSLLNTREFILKH